MTVSVNAEGKILQDTELSMSDLAQKLLAISENRTERRVFVRGDKGVNYGRVMETMAAITQGGFTKVALLAEQTKELSPTIPLSDSPGSTGPASTRR